jgi:general secretion pathway protein D
MKKTYPLICILFAVTACLWAGVFTADSVLAQDDSPAEQDSGTKYVSIDFDEVDIRVFIKFISELTSENFIVDNQVKGTVNILSPGRITVDEAYRVFESVLEVYGFTAVRAGGITKILPIPEARSRNVETRLLNVTGEAEDRIVTQLIPLKFADSEMIKQLFTPLLSKGAVILGYGPTNTVIVTDVYSNIRRLQKIIEKIDVRDVGRKITVIPILHADALKLEKLLGTLFQSQAADPKKSLSDKPVHFVADERTNHLIVLASEFDTANIRELVAMMDRETPKSEAKIQVHYLENAKAEDLAGVLQSLAEGVSAGEPGKQSAPLVSSRVKITHDKATNSLIIMADKEDYLVLETIIQKLDIPRPMVYIEALIMEVRDTDEFSLGVEWISGTSAGTIDGRSAGAFGGFTSTPQSGGVSALPTISNNTVALPGGFSMGVMTEAITIGGIVFPNIGAAVRALKKNEEIRIISTPQIMTTDNEEAEISVGENVPFLTTSGSGEQNFNSFDYRDVGVVLRITPQISQGRFVRLNIYQKVEKMTAQSTNSQTPTTLKRTAETTVVVKDRATVVIGGLIGEDMNSADYQVPCLGDVPFAGHLFKSTSREGVRTNLYIFLTPRIIENPNEAEAVFQEKKESVEDRGEQVIPLYKSNEKEVPEKKP